ncbi:MAG: enoyl-CoA hydratase/isomerase family protein [Anaeromyxobacteraceae bacterium]
MSYPNFQTIKITQEGPLAIITIDRESQLNALSSTVISELTQAAATLQISDEIGVVVVTGAGKAFVAGADIAEMQELTPPQAQAFAEMGGALGVAIEHSENAWIAAVNGFALGGGCELAMACDLVYASEAARFGQPEVNLGIMPGFGGTQRLARRVGIMRAKELVLTGDMVDAAKAKAIGLALEVLPAAELVAYAVEKARKIASRGPAGIAQAKRAIEVGAGVDLATGCALELEGFGVLFSTDDAKEGMRAFLEKRAPAFKGT